MEPQNNPLCLLWQNFIQYLEEILLIVIVCKEEGKKNHKHNWVCDFESMIKHENVSSGVCKMLPFIHHCSYSLDVNTFKHYSHKAWQWSKYRSDEEAKGSVWPWQIQRCFMSFEPAMTPLPAHCPMGRRRISLLGKIVLIHLQNSSKCMRVLKNTVEKSPFPI